MSVPQPRGRLDVPLSLETQLHGFRRRVWKIKMIEAACIAVFAVVVAFLSVFTLDRLWDTPATIRLGVFLTALCGCAVVPLFIYRWIWRQQRLEQLARLLSHKLSVGEQLLGIIELAHSESEQARSRTLCAAAIQQVAQDAQGRDFLAATPDSRHRLWSWFAGTTAGIAMGLTVFFPAAAVNAMARFLAPWSETPRYTFAAVESLPDQMYIPHGEPVTLTVRLTEGSLWQPAEGQVQLGRQAPIQAQLEEGRYDFELPPQIETGALRIRIGDADRRVQIQPTLRPELTSVVAEISLPKYLELPKPLRKDVRGGAISLVKGSRATFTATAGRNLSSATIDGQPQTPAGDTITATGIEVEGSRKIDFQWKDDRGLAGKEPFLLMINGLDDEAPSLACENLPRKKVVLDSEQLTFRVKAQDDFGIKRLGMEWEGLNEISVEKLAKGERVLAAGGSDKSSLDVAGTFTAKSLGIEPQLIQLRVFAEDYLPGRERVYSPPYLLYVLNADQHAIWLTEQMNKWHRRSLEVRDREMQLYETNKQLRNMSPDELNQVATRKRIEQQAAGERANGRRLSALTASGEELVRQASRNPEFGVGHLEKWAEMLQILKDISANRMPSVADLLKDASQAKNMAAKTPSQSGPKAGQVRAQGSGAPSEEEPDKKKPSPPVPQVVDVESTQQPPDDKAGPAPPKKGGAASLRLPVTTLLGGGPKGDACPAGKKMEEAVTKQEELLAEFEKIADELNKILANLEGSTLLKRLKAVSREQYRIAGKIGDQLDNSFGLAPTRIKKTPKATLTELTGLELKSSDKVSLIMDDMQAYFERRRLMPFKDVLEDMKKQDVVGGLRELGDDIPREQGLSIAQCEYWSDTLDRWAEDLVDPASGGT